MPLRGRKSSLLVGLDDGRHHGSGRAGGPETKSRLSHGQLGLPSFGRGQAGVPRGWHKVVACSHKVRYFHQSGLYSGSNSRGLWNQARAVEAIAGIPELANVVT